jgi:hypothetical protein
VKVGLTAGFGEPLGAARDFIESIGFAFVRQEIRADATDRTIAALLGEFLGRPITLLALLGGGKNRTAAGARIEPRAFAALASRVVRAAAQLGLTGYMIEVGNEPDIGHPGYATRPEEFASAVAQTEATVRQAGFAGPLISGGISNLSTERLDYLAQMAPRLPPDVVVGFHRYPRADRPDEPHPGFASRDAEWARLQEIAGARSLACTEFGHHSAPRRQRLLGFLPRRSRRVPDEIVAEYVAYDLEAFQSKGCELAAVYQLNDGPTDRPVDRYGIRRPDGTPKPSADAIAAFIDLSG